MSFRTTFCVLRYLYGFQEEVDRFFDEEVRDAVLLAKTFVHKFLLTQLYQQTHYPNQGFLIQVRDAVLLAKTFVLKFLLTQLYDQDHFPNWGCAMWDAARDMAERVSEELNPNIRGIEGMVITWLEELLISNGSLNPNIRGIEGMAHNWLDELLFDADVHFEKDIFEKDGAMTLSDTGCKILLRHSALNCEEMLVFVSVMKFVQAIRRDVATEMLVFVSVMKFVLVRWGEIDSAQVAQWDRKQEKKEKEKLKKEEEERQAQLEGTLLDSPRDEDKDKIIVKPEAYKPRFKYEGVAKPFLRLVRYPFISPERLNKEDPTVGHP
ncbi:hypothetical protein T484DRAFT_1814849 [Baffinella frigidus]|nr:hypothetical protein T484DRAFT_1814849 [Cryptophyta sp. CCMP2293]